MDQFENSPEFWNPKRRGPVCYNPQAARTVLPINLIRTRLALAGKSKAEMKEGMKAAIEKGELPALEPPAAVKDVKRFGDKKWGYFSLMSDSKPIPSKTMSPDECWSCHNKNGAVGNTFVQFYPTLKPIAEEKGTYKESGAGR